LVPARVGELIFQPQFGIDPLNYRHPIVVPFRGRERAGLLTTPISRYYKLDTSHSSPGTEIVAAVGGGNPLIVAAPLGLGRVVLVATDGSLSSVDPASGEPWTTWPTWPSYLPVVRELLAYAVEGRSGAGQHLVGAALGGSVPLPLSNQSTGDRLEITRPDGRNAAVSIRALAGETSWSYSDADLSGIYSLHGQPNDERRPFAVNVDTTESDLAKADLQQLPAGITVRDTWQHAEGEAANILSHSDWSGHLLWAALALLFVESFMAWQFGRGIV
jgi:outer membrane protein assembly factor BamB